jgi:hypothetical protein
VVTGYDKRHDHHPGREKRIDQVRLLLRQHLREVWITFHKLLDGAAHRSVDDPQQEHSDGPTDEPGTLHGSVGGYSLATICGPYSP